MDRQKIYLSGIAADGAEVAREFGLGMEITEFSTPWYMDKEFPEADRRVEASLAGIGNRILHGPYSELFPCAIDPMIRTVAKERFIQALKLAQRYGATKVVLHGGFNPYIYYPVWFTGESVKFWRDLAEQIPEKITVCVENVLEPDPEMLLEIVSAVDSPKIRLCLDVGHVNAYCRETPENWLEKWGGYISHFHIHNNWGSQDTHSGLDAGSVDMAAFLRRAEKVCPEATYTLEVLEARSSVAYLQERGFL